MVNCYSFASPGPPSIFSILVLILIRLVGRGWCIGRRGSIGVVLVAVSGLQVLVLLALGQASGETTLLHNLNGCGGSHRELCRDVSLGGG